MSEKSQELFNFNQHLGAECQRSMSYCYNSCSITSVYLTDGGELLEVEAGTGLTQQVQTMVEELGAGRGV